MDPNIFGGGVARIEHFDTVLGQARQHAKLNLSVSQAYSADIYQNALNAFAAGNNTIYALGRSPGLGFAVFQWSAGPNYWIGLTEQIGLEASILTYYKGALYGLRSGGNIWKCTVGGIYTATVDTIKSYTTYADPVVHSKDGKMYFFVDNEVWDFDGVNASSSAVLALPTTFVITSACEFGDYLLIAGYDSSSGISTAYLWDRDSSLTTLTAKYDLGTDRVKHVANIGGTGFFISQRLDSANSPNTDKMRLVIRYLRGDRAEILRQFEFESLSIPKGAYSTNEKLFFPAYVKMKGDASGKNVIVSIDQRGGLSFELNLGVMTQVPPTNMGLIREGDGWWIGGGINGSWNSVNAYDVVSSFETSVISPGAFNQNLRFRGATITCDPLPSGASIVLRARVNEQTAWTTLQTFSTANAVKFSTNHPKCINALNKLAMARRAQFRIEVTGSTSSPIILTGFQCVFDPLLDETYE
jgi:hypothetical protein